MISIMELLNSLSVIEVKGDTDRMINGIYYNSRDVQPGSLFVAVGGYKSDGHCYINEAVKRGASTIVRDKDIAGNGINLKGEVTDIFVTDSRKALALLATEFYHHPSRELGLIGVTGTNGKTTITYLLDSVLRCSGLSVGVVGTISYSYNNHVLPATTTTPESLDLQRMLRDMVNRNVNYCVLEVSSHSLELKRVVGCDFQTAIFTNLSQDHLDFHKSLDNYFEAKARLFKDYPVKTAVINLDDPYGERLLKAVPGKVITYGINKSADISAEEVKCSPDGLSFTARTPLGQIDIQSPLLGRHNVYNVLAVIGAAICNGIDIACIKEGVKAVKGVLGRFERIEEGQNYTVAVDYAHTPDALKNLLRAAREITNKKVILIFGCGGDRDRLKRPLMGNAAARLADFTIITSDNPRSEEPLKIIEEIEKGFSEAGGKQESYIKVAERKEAIHKGLELAEEGDLVLIAGKGHETYQIIGNKKRDFDDREVARGFLRNRREERDV
jgi:UDP-N-acetylmuramoyl-L-alanyl-D-glutamate--2,6-diaminopimelate ligase